MKRRMMVLCMLFSLLFSPASTAEATAPGASLSAQEALLEVKGVDLSDWAPDEPISRLAFAHLLTAYLDLTLLAERLEPIPLEIKDAAVIASVDRGVVNVLTALGYFRSGRDVRFRPEDSLTQVEAATALLRVLELDPEAKAPYPMGPMMKAVDSGLVTEWEAAADDPVTMADAAAFLTALYKQTRPDCLVVGLVTGADEVSLALYTEAGRTERYPLSGWVSLHGAETRDALIGHMVLGVLNDDEALAYLETPERVVTTSGVLRDYHPRRGLLLDETWVRVDGPLRWAFNGFPVMTSDAEELQARWVEWKDMEATVTIHTDPTGRGNAWVRHWDIPQAVVLAVDRDKGEATIRMACPWSGTRESQLVWDQTDEWPVAGAVTCLSELERGDVLRLSTLGGWGLFSGTAEEVDRVEVVRKRIRGEVKEAPVWRHHYEDGRSLHYRLGESDGVARVNTFLGDLEATFSDAVWLEVALGFEGDGVAVVDAISRGSMPPVVLEEYRMIQGVPYLQVYDGIRSLRLPTVLGDEALREHLTGRFIDQITKLRFDESGRVDALSGRAQRIEDLVGDGQPNEKTTIISFSEAESCVTLRVDSPDGSRDYAAVVASAIYDESGESLGWSDAMIGAAVSVWELETLKWLILED